MNKEVEEAKEVFRHWRDFMSEKEGINAREELIHYFDVLLNYIQKLEEDNNAYNEEEIALNNRIMELEDVLNKYGGKEELEQYIWDISKYLGDVSIDCFLDEIQKTIHKERELAEAQTTYEVNEMWKQKIRDKIEELILIKDNGANAVRFAMSHEDEIERTQKQKDINTMIKILQELLNEEE